MQVRPEGLRVGGKGVEAGDGGRTPEVCCSPAICLELGVLRADGVGLRMENIFVMKKPLLAIA